MPVRAYKQKCMRCKQQWVLVQGRNPYPLCYDCQKTDLSRTITDPAMKKFFAIPETFYAENSFLRSIKSTYLQTGILTDRQKEAFVRTVDQLHQKAKEKKN